MQQKYLACAFTLACLSCSYEATIDVRVYGEEFIEDGIPADAFIDGWTVNFDKFLVVVGGIEFDNDRVSFADWYLVDLARNTGGEGQSLGIASVSDGPYNVFGYRLAPNAGAIPVGTTDADAELIRDNSVYVSGTAQRGTTSFRFTWTFASDTTYSPCEIGIELKADEQVTTEITIHADHLFYDDLDTSEPNLAFDLIASADANGDGDITKDELLAVDITGETRYQTGSRNISNLWDFIDAQVQTLGHINGEGHCDAKL